MERQRDQNGDGEEGRLCPARPPGCPEGEEAWRALEPSKRVSRKKTLPWFLSSSCLLHHSSSLSLSSSVPEGLSPLALIWNGTGSTCVFQRPSSHRPIRRPSVLQRSCLPLNCCLTTNEVPLLSLGPPAELQRFQVSGGFATRVTPYLRSGNTSNLLSDEGLCSLIISSSSGGEEVKLGGQVKLNSPY